MKFKKQGIACLFGTVFAFASFQAGAKDVTSGKYGNDPWGMSGCGFASLFISNKEQSPQIGSSVLNYLFSGPTNSSAISSGTSNCVAQGKKVAFNQKELFITVNLSSLSKEAAEGNGEHIAALADVFGCPQNEFAKLSQSRYESIYSINEPQSVLQNYIKEVNADQNLSKRCQKLI